MSMREQRTAIRNKHEGKCEERRKYEEKDRLKREQQ